MCDEEDDSTGKSAEVERRIDPEDGRAYTFQELWSFYEQKHFDEVLTYWQSTSVPDGKRGCKAKPSRRGALDLSEAMRDDKGASSAAQPVYAGCHFQQGQEVQKKWRPRKARPKPDTSLAYPRCFEWEIPSQLLFPW